MVNHEAGCEPTLAFWLDQSDDGSLTGEVYVGAEPMPIKGQVCGDQIWFTTEGVSVLGGKYRVAYAGAVNESGSSLYLNMVLIADDEIVVVKVEEFGCFEVIFRENFEGDEWIASLPPPLPWDQVGAQEWYVFGVGAATKCGSRL